MFNSPRPGQRYMATSNHGFGGSFVDENPLAASVYDGLDPWSAAPSPSPPPPPSGPTVFSSVIADATVPPVYGNAFSLVDPNNTGETSVNSLSRILGTSSLPAATVDKIVNLVSSRPRVSKLEFFVALALVALAQSGKDVSIEQVAALSSQNTLPEPRLDIDSFQPTLSSVEPPAINVRQDDILPVRSPAPVYASEDPWSSRFNPATSNAAFKGIGRGNANGSPSNLFGGSGMPKDWWKKQDKVKITILGHQGFILNRYMVYEVATDRGPPVPRRYSEFVFLWECLTRRYPFRLICALPPKRIGPDAHFLEQRRRGLTRALSFVINHPIIKDDGLLTVFLTEPSFETWRKHTSVSLEEESVTKRVDRIEELSIPSDLEDKLAMVRGKLGPLIEHWHRICILADRIIKRREAAAVRFPTYGRIYFPTHFAFSPYPPSTSSPTSTHSSPSLWPSQPSFMPYFIADMMSSDDQADLSRIANTLRAVNEINEHPWRGENSELDNGVRQGLEHVAKHAQRYSDLSEQRTRTLLDTTLEALRSQTDLYIAMRDLFLRHDRLSIDQVERLKKRVDSNSIKMEGVKAAQKEGWQEEADRILGLVEKDQATIASQIHRRGFIRACMWHELRVVLHNRENTFLTLAVKAFARDEQEHAETVMGNWVSLVEAVEGMPLE